MIRGDWNSLTAILVSLWCDVEDYITPRSDDPPKKIIEILRRYGINATFKVVAEKLRALETRQRQDVTAALATVDIGYHLNTHSTHPTLYEYLGDKDLRTGAAEFFERENDGRNYVNRVLGRPPSCFGHPGSAWTPHVYPALPKMGIPTYLDETPILNLHNSPYWYCNVLNLNGANSNFILLDYFFEQPEGLNRIKKRFKQIYKRLRRNGGVVSILLHPHTIVNSKFWDEVNFAKGKNPSSNEYVLPPPQPQETTERAYRDFEEFVKYMKGFPEVKFITARDAVSIFKDHSKSYQFDLENIRKLARRTVRNIQYQETDGICVSPAQIFSLMSAVAASYAETSELPKKTAARTPLGPLAKTKTKGSRTMLTKRLLEVSRSVVDALDREGYIPTDVVVDNTTLSPQDYLATICSLLVSITGGKIPRRISVKKGNLNQSKYVNRRALEKACRWIMLPEDFKAPRLLEQTLLQTWTLKPATATSN